MFRYALLLMMSLLALTACSPSLNWREVRASQGELKVMLPCKPDQGSRKQTLAGLELEVHMSGCEAGGALFAVSSVSLYDPTRALAVQLQWQAAMLENMRAGTSASSPYRIRGATPLLEPVRLKAQGQDPAGRGVSVEGVWFAHGARLYHAAIYAERIGAEMSEPFFGGLELP